MSHSSLPQLLKEQGALSSSQIVSYMVEKLGISHSAARKRLERAARKGCVTRFVALKGNQFLYCLPHQQVEARRKVEKRLRKWKPRLYRLFRTLGKAKILTLWDASRITALLPKSKSFERILSEIELLGLATKREFIYEKKAHQFLVSETLKASGRTLANILENYCRQLREEKSFIHLTEKWLIRNRLARNFGQTGFRSELFDSVGRSISPRFSLVLFDVNLRRSISNYEMQGFIERVYKFISSRTVKFPVYSFFVAKDFSRNAWKLGEKVGIKRIRSRYIPHYRVQRRPGGLLLLGTEISEEDLKYWIMVARQQKELKDVTRMKGLAFEYAVAMAFTKHGYKELEIGKEYFTKNGKITEKRAGRTFTDIDIQAVKENETYEILLCECKNWNRQIDRESLLGSVEKMNKIIEYLRTEKSSTLNKKLLIRTVIIGSCYKKDVERAKQKAIFNIEILARSEFGEKYCQHIKGLSRYQWLFE